MGFNLSTFDHLALLIIISTLLMISERKLNTKPTKLCKTFKLTMLFTFTLFLTAHAMDLSSPLLGDDAADDIVPGWPFLEDSVDDIVPSAPLLEDYHYNPDARMSN